MVNGWTARDLPSLYLWGDDNACALFAVKGSNSVLPDGPLGKLSCDMRTI